jgi:hypothetical protein
MQVTGCKWRRQGDDLVVLEVGPYELLLPENWHAFTLREAHPNAWFAGGVVTRGIGLSFSAIDLHPGEALPGTIANLLPPGCSVHPMELTIAGRRFEGGHASAWGGVWEVYAGRARRGLLSFGLTWDAEALRTYHEVVDRVRTMVVNAVAHALLRAEGPSTAGEQRTPGPEPALSLQVVSADGWLEKATEGLRPDTLAIFGPRLIGFCGITGIRIHEMALGASPEDTDVTYERDAEAGQVRSVSLPGFAKLAAAACVADEACAPIPTQAGAADFKESLERAIGARTILLASLFGIRLQWLSVLHRTPYVVVARHDIEDVVPLERLREGVRSMVRQEVAGLEPRPHDSVAREQEAIAWDRVNRGQYEEAEEPLQRAIAIWKTAYGEEHASTLNAEIGLAAVYRGLGDLGRAVELLQRVSDRATFCAGEGAAGLHHRALRDLCLNLRDGGDLARATDIERRTAASRAS